jgi:tetratricopeptide (TPR) repeat protein
MITASFEALLRSARRALAEGRVDEAAHHYEKARGLRPDSPDAHYGLATAEFILNDVEGAAFHFREVTRLDPLRAGAYVNLGAALTRLGEHREAVQVLRRGIQLEPKRAEGYYNLGLVYRAAHDNPHAIQAFLEATRMDPGSADAHFNLGNSLMEEGQFARAAEAFMAALRVQPGWDKAEHGLAQAEQALAAELASAQPSVPLAPIAQPERRIDPTRNQVALEIMHESIKAAQAASDEFLQALATDVGPSVKELTQCLIGRQPDRTAPDLDHRIKKFEIAVARLRKAHDDMQGHLGRAQSSGERIARS